MIRRELLSFLPPFNDSVYYDWWLAYTAACMGKIGYTSKVLVKYRVHPKSYTSRHPSNHALRRIDMLKHFQEHPLTSAETADFIGHLIEKYVTNQGKGFSWSLFLDRKSTRLNSS